MCFPSQFYNRSQTYYQMQAAFSSASAAFPPDEAVHQAATGLNDGYPALVVSKLETLLGGIKSMFLAPQYMFQRHFGTGMVFMTYSKKIAYGCNHYLTKAALKCEECAAEIALGKLNSMAGETRDDAQSHSMNSDISSGPSSRTAPSVCADTDEPSSRETGKFSPFADFSKPFAQKEPLTPRTQRAMALREELLRKGLRVPANVPEPFYCCRFCHDESITTHSFNPSSVKEVLCLMCGKVGPIQQFCAHCGKKLAEYYCEKCHILSDMGADCRPAFHCDKCNACVVGHRELTRHCDKCNRCYPLQLYHKHKCDSRLGCCILCLENLDTSIFPFHLLPCGFHYCHDHCLKNLKILGDKGRLCPACKKPISFDETEEFLQKKRRMQFQWAFLSFDTPPGFQVNVCHICGQNFLTWRPYIPLVTDQLETESFSSDESSLHREESEEGGSDGEGYSWPARPGRRRTLRSQGAWEAVASSDSGRPVAKLSTLSSSSVPDASSTQDPLSVSLCNRHESGWERTAKPSPSKHGCFSPLEKMKQRFIGPYKRLMKSLHINWSLESEDAEVVQPIPFPGEYNAWSFGQTSSPQGGPQPVSRRWSWMSMLHNMSYHDRGKSDLTQTISQAFYHSLLDQDSEASDQAGRNDAGDGRSESTIPFVARQILKAPRGIKLYPMPNLSLPCLNPACSSFDTSLAPQSLWPEYIRQLSPELSQNHPEALRPQVTVTPTEQASPGPGASAPPVKTLSLTPEALRALRMVRKSVIKVFKETGSARVPRVYARPPRIAERFLMVHGTEVESWLRDAAASSLVQEAGGQREPPDLGGQQGLPQLPQSHADTEHRSAFKHFGVRASAFQAGLSRRPGASPATASVHQDSDRDIIQLEEPETPPQQAAPHPASSGECGGQLPQLRSFHVPLILSDGSMLTVSDSQLSAFLSERAIGAPGRPLPRRMLIYLLWDLALDPALVSPLEADAP